jgi:hypothetical protein
MDRRKIESAALFLAILGTALVMPPLVQLFQHDQRVFGIPAEVVYLFVVWTLLVLGAFWLGRRLPAEDNGAPADLEDES